MGLNITLVSEDTGAITTAQVQPTDKVHAMQGKVHNDMGIPPASQQLHHNGNPLDPQTTVTASGLEDGDLIMVHRRNPPSNPSPPPPSSPSLPTPAALFTALRADTAVMERLRLANPSLHARVNAGDLTALSEVVNLMTRHTTGAPAQPVQDPMSADAQKAIEDRIRHENVMQNLEAAIEHNPESFGTVVMLFVDCKVNSVPNVKAFVDSGAQTTIISKECAERCNVLRLLDTRFSGIARGVGTAKIHGRIHLALLTLQDEIFEVSLTVMESIGGDYDMLLGLDMLRKHQASVDLKANCLRIGNSAVPFLSEKDIPARMRAQVDPSASPTAVPTGSASGQQSSSAGTSNIDDESIRKLTDIGFSRSDALLALQACNGNKDQAADMLMARKHGF